MIIFEISKSYVKALWAKNVLNDIQIKGIAAKPLENDSQEELAKVISSIINEKLYREFKPLVVCVPRNLVILRNLEFPVKDQNELDSILDLHLTQEVPYAREEIIHNYRVLGKNQAGFTSLILSIIHRRTLVKMFSAFESLNFYPDNMLLSTYGLMQFFSKSNIITIGKETVACMDIGDEFSDFFVFRGKKVLFSKSINISAQDLKGGEKLSRFISELKQIMIVFQTERGINPTCLIISGVKRVYIGFENGFDSMFDMPVKLIDPAEVFPSIKDVDDYEDVEDAVSISALCGMTLSPLSDEMSFVLPEAKLRRETREIAKNLFIMGGLVLYFVVLILLAFMIRIYAKDTYLSDLNRAINIKNMSNRKTVEALDRLKALKGFENYDDSFLFYYYKLSEITPRNIALDRLVFSKKKEFSILGRATDMGDIYKFVRSINNEKILGKADLRYSRKLDNGESEFDIKCTLSG